MWLVIGLVVVLAVSIVAFVSQGHAGSGTAAQQLQSWASSTTLGQDVGTLTGDGRNVALALHDRKGSTAVRTVCAAMANDAQTFNDQLPSPDSSVTQWLAKAYGLDYDAAEACYKAGATNRALLAQSSADRARAEALFEKVLARVGSVTGHPVSTTTTTVPNTTSTSLL